MTKRALVCGAGGFIGNHLVKRLRREGFRVRGVDLKYPEFSPTEADDFIVGDLRDPVTCRAAVDQRFDEVYQLAADMGGAGKKLRIRNIPGPLGVRDRNCDNRLIERMLGWRPSQPLLHGLKKTYPWIEQQVKASRQGKATGIAQLAPEAKERARA